MHNPLYTLCIISIFLIISGCQSKPTKYNNVTWVKAYSHKTHGELLASDIIVINAIDACSNKAFPGGVIINGKLENNGEAIINEYSKHKLKFASKASKRTNKSLTESEALKIAEAYASSAPEYVKVAHQNKHIYKKCFYDEQGFIFYRKRIPFDQDTGQRLKYNKETKSLESHIPK